MGVFSKTPIVNSESLNIQTNNILGIFSKTVEELRGVVSKAEEQITIKTSEIVAAETERNALQSLVDKNEQIIVKLENFIN